MPPSCCSKTVNKDPKLEIVAQERAQIEVRGSRWITAKDIYYKERK